VEYFGDTVPEYTPEWGPSWSSQKTACPQCCERQETCNARSCGEAQIFLPWCLLDSGTFPNSNLVDGDTSTLYKPGCLDCGRQWFVVGIQEPLYIDEVAIYLTGVEGHIASIRGAEKYAGENTDWTHVWAAGDDDSLRPRELLSMVEWAPPLCPHYRRPMRWLRVEYDTANMTIFPGFNRIKVTGSLAPHASAVHNSHAKLLYEPLPGVVASDKQDSIVVRASDCTAWSSPSRVAIAKASELYDRIPGPDDVFGDRQRIVVALRTRTLVTIDLDPVVAHLKPYLTSTAESEGEQLLAEAFSHADSDVVLEGVHEESGVKIFKSGTGEAVPPGEDVALGAGGGDGVLIEDESFLPVSLYFRATCHNVTYRLEMEVLSECPAGASMFECARGPEDCVPDCVSNGGVTCSRAQSDPIVFDPWNRKCAYAANDPSSTDKPAIVGISLGAVVALVALLLLWFKVRSLHCQ
jgi:hypothetical protein